MAQDFLAFAVDGGANVIDQATYEAAAGGGGFVAVGYAAGLAQSAQLNKTWRQSSVIARTVAQFIADTLGEDVLDNGDLAAILAQFKEALAQYNGSTVPTIITASVNRVLTTLEKEVILKRTAGVAPFDLTLPGLAVGQQISVTDVVGNLFANPVTVIPPAGTIDGSANFTMNKDKQSQSFIYYDVNLWGVK